MKKHKRVVHIFRRDLRLQDNTALARAAAQADEVVPLFCLDPRQIESHPYRSEFGLRFLLESLVDLDVSLREQGTRLRVVWGKADDMVPKVVQSLHASAVYFNRDYTPFSRSRDESIRRALALFDCETHQFADCLLHEPGEVRKGDGQPYTVFTPFYKRAQQLGVRQPDSSVPDNWFKGEIEDELTSWQERLSSYVAVIGTYRGGRTAGLGALSQIAKFVSYKEMRNLPAVEGTTRLSPHHKFGTVSPRETHSAILHAFGEGHELIRELYWRDFFTHIAANFPRVFDGAFYQQYDQVPWVNDEKAFARWCSGETGFPIVDAGMRELNSTGFMHNRARMIVASFLTKDLHINWQWGERYFATKLVDYDPSVNNGSWQWAASTGCDAQPYFRIFNPWLQQEKFDSECVYIKRWLPELRDISAKRIHQIPQLGERLTPNYPAPMVDHVVAKKQAEMMLGQVVKR